MLSGCGSPKTTGKEESPLEKAIALYIEGDLAAAELIFIEVTQQQSSPEDLQTAYLYLGRIYMARGEYDLAAEAFSSGRLLGGDIRFEEYFELAKMRSGASPESVSGHATVTRGQLAALILTMFAGALDNGGVAGRTVTSDTTRLEPRDARNNGIDYAVAVVPTGVMRVLPDGEFHPEAKLTLPAFYLVLTRLSARLGIETGVIQTMFPDGYRGVVADSDAPADGDTGRPFVSGRDVVDRLRRIKNAAGL
ncbi:MAG: tetratricopeptide repeat protein [Candidatus Latescibacterota bacterium]|nr:MAG: tetratricopeptide repeat protein [Candidatus Latescibacterota bacterium]